MYLQGWYHKYINLFNLMALRIKMRLYCIIDNCVDISGGAIWHPRCGPGPTENGAIINGVENGHCTDTETEAESGRDTAFDRMSSSAVSDMQVHTQKRPYKIAFFNFFIFALNVTLNVTLNCFEIVNFLFL